MLRKTPVVSNTSSNQWLPTGISSFSILAVAWLSNQSKVEPSIPSGGPLVWSQPLCGLEILHCQHLHGSPDSSDMQLLLGDTMGRFTAFQNELSPGMSSPRDLFHSKWIGLKGGIPDEFDQKHFNTRVCGVSKPPTKKGNNKIQQATSPHKSSLHLSQIKSYGKLWKFWDDWQYK